VDSIIEDFSSKILDQRYADLIIENFSSKNHHLRYADSIIEDFPRLKIQNLTLFYIG
jgi:hypothetical protein